MSGRGGAARARARIATTGAIVLALAAPVARAARVSEAGDASGGAHVEWVFAAAGRDSAAPGGLSAPAYWRARAAGPARSPAALHVLAGMRLAAGDSAGADSCWRALAAARGPWQVDAALSLADLALSRAGAAAAESLLAGTRLVDAPPAEAAARIERLSALRAAAGDGAGAESAAREVVTAFPAVPAVAERALARLDSLLAARRESLDVAGLRAAAEVEWFRGARPAAIARLRRAFAGAAGRERFGASLRLAQVLREARMPRAAGVAAESALALAPDPDRRTAAELERARALRSAGATDSALALYARIGRGTAEPEARATAWWELAREAEDRGRYREALAGFGRCAQAGGRRADDARFQAGLIHFVLGSPDSAALAWRRSRGEAPRFWLAVVTRRTERALSDSLLGELARAPGFGYYRAAARETLGVGVDADGAGTVADAVPPRIPALARLERGGALGPPAQEDGVVAEARALLEGGREADAAQLLGLVLARDPRVAGEAARSTPALLAAASVAFDAGRAPLGTRLAEAAFAAAGSDSEAWAAVPWAYPPAYAAEMGAAASVGVERELMWALVRQESRFDPRARSRSDALGLTQLLLPAARDMATALHEPPPGEAALLSPATSIRYGARYLAGLLRRFDGRVPVALVAYNAGAATVRRDWRELIARGGDALFCELASNADSQDYARRILGFRRAYRALRPAVAAH